MIFLYSVFSVWFFFFVCCCFCERISKGLYEEKCWRSTIQTSVKASLAITGILLLVSALVLGGVCVVGGNKG